MQRYSPALAILLVVPLACEKQGSTTTPSEPTAATTEPESAPVEDAEPIDEIADEQLSEEDEALWDEMTAEDAELEAELDGSSVGGFGGRGNIPRVLLAKHTVEGNLDPDIVRRIVRAHLNELRSCYDAGLAKDETLAGTVTVEFTIRSNGFVKSGSAVDSDAFADATVPACMVEAVEKWQFPKPSGGEVKVIFPFVLDPG